MQVPGALDFGSDGFLPVVEGESGEGTVLEYVSCIFSKLRVGDLPVGPWMLGCIL